MKSIQRILLSAFCCAVGLSTFAGQVLAARRNVLMIAVDDLRPTLGAYGSPIIRTPNIDALARQGIVFNRAYCQQAVCSPSRTSLLTGRRPDTTRVYNLQDHFRIFLPDVVTLPQHFKNHGYHTQGLSKIYHGGLDDPQSWTVPHWTPGLPAYGNPGTVAALQAQREKARAQGRSTVDEVVQRDTRTGTVLRLATPSRRIQGPSWEQAEVRDNELPDGATADKAIEVLRSVQSQPFFLAVGFLKPHLPFVAPKKYFDLYPEATVPIAQNPAAPADVPPIALTNFGELRAYSDIPDEGPIGEAKARQLTRAYYAAASYTDAQIGRVLDELKRLGLHNNTIVVLWGDHGWQLGEHGLWCKHTNFELATRAPLIVSTPDSMKRGGRTNALVEFVDIYPTLCELAGLPAPSGLEGRSMVPLFKNPNRTWKQAAFSQYPRGKVMGYSMRTDRYRYTEWVDEQKSAVARELYDHEKDPEENYNVASRPANEKLIKELSAKLRVGWKAASPRE